MKFKKSFFKIFLIILTILIIGIALLVVCNSQIRYYVIYILMPEKAKYVNFLKLTNDKGQEIYLLGTWHREHWRSKRYTLWQIEAVIDHLRPDILLIESRPEDLERSNWVQGPLEMLFANLTACSMSIKVKGMDWWVIELFLLAQGGLKKIHTDDIKKEGNMAYKKKSWKEKLEDNKNFPEVLEFDPRFPCGRALEKMGAKPGDSVVLPRPLEVNEIMEKVPAGKLITLNEICKKLARKHKTKYCCTLTSGIFVMTAANAAEETKSDVPYWRTIKNNGELNEKYPGGAESQKKQLEKEGHTIIRKGKKYYVKNYEEKII